MQKYCTRWLKMLNYLLGFGKILQIQKMALEKLQYIFSRNNTICKNKTSNFYSAIFCELNITLHLNAYITCEFFKFMACELRAIEIVFSTNTTRVISSVQID